MTKSVRGFALGAAAAGMTVGLVFFNAHSVSVMKESPADAAVHHEQTTARPGVNIFSKQNLEKLRRGGVVVIDNVLSATEVAEAKRDVDNMMKNDKFGENGNEDTDIRTDSVNWISESIGEDQIGFLPPALLRALRVVRSIPRELQRSGDYAGLELGVPLSNQLACYDGQGAHYVAHRDGNASEKKDGTSEEFTHPLKWLLRPGMDDREVTIILYLNDSTWDSNCDDLTDSGHLKVYVDADSSDETGESASSVINIQPVGGRMVVFNSHTILHEVMPSGQRRRALTCWVGGKHSTHSWMKPLCLPPGKTNWRRVFNF
jgi:hypothetical protein